MNEQCIEVQCPGPTCLSNDFAVCWTAKCPISSLLVSFLTALALHLPRWNHCSLAVSFIPDFSSPFIQWPGCLLKSHILFIPGNHPIIQARNVSATSFISIPFMGLGAAGFGPGPIIGFFVVFSSCSIFLISAAWLFHSSVDIFLRSTLGNAGRWKKNCGSFHRWFFFEANRTPQCHFIVHFLPW